MPTLKTSFRSTSAVARRFVLTLLIASLGGALCALESKSVEIATPTFGSGSLADLQVSVVEVRNATEYLSVLTVEVTNRGKIDAEPLMFRIDLPTKKSASPTTGKQKQTNSPSTTGPSTSSRFARADLPHFQRFGRPTPAGGKQRYYLNTGLTGKKSEYKVTIENASFVQGGAIAKPILRISAPKQIQATSFTGTFPVTDLRIENPLDFEMDALFLVTFKQPRDVTTLLGVHLPASVEFRWQIGSFGGATPFPAVPDLPANTVQVSKVELVDWSLVAPADESLGIAMFEQAYRNWVRWPDPQPTVSGDFSYRVRQLRLNSQSEYDSFEVQGRFTIDEKNKLQVEIRSGGGANASMLIGRAFKHLRRESLENVIAENEIVPIDSDVVEIRGPGIGPSRYDGRKLSTEGATMAGDADFYRVRGGRIVGSGSTMSMTSTVMDGEEIWDTTVLGDGYVISRMARGRSRFTCSYSVLHGLVVPTHATMLTQYSESPFSSEEVSFSNLELNGADRVERKTPIGEGAAALRSIWDSGWHITTEPIDIRAKFEVVNPGTDWVWHGLKNLKGRVVMRGIGKSQREIRVEFDDIDDREKEISLASAFADRLLMWYGRDPNDRDSFDTQFEGCQIAAMAEDGSFAIEGRSLSKILTSNGRYVGHIVRGGDKTLFTHQKVGEQIVCTKVEAELDNGNAEWKESVAMSFTSVGGYLLPNSFRFERIFAPDWGPETILFKDIVVEPGK